MILESSLEHLHAIELPTPFPVGPVTVYLADAPDEPLTLIDTGPRRPKAGPHLKRGWPTWAMRWPALAALSSATLTWITLGWPQTWLTPRVHRCGPTPGTPNAGQF